MKTKTKILLDNLVGGPFIILLNVLARSLGFILRIDHSLNKPLNKIVVCKYLGLGSIIQATPLLQTLKKNYPNAKIIFVTTVANEGLLKATGIVDEVLTINDKSFFNLMKTSARLLYDLWQRRPEVYVDLELHSNYSNLISTLSLTTNRLAYFKKNKKYRKGVYTHMIKFEELRPISETYLQFATLLGCTEIITDLAPLLNKEKLEASLKELGPLIGFDTYQPYIVINPNASDLRLERRWPKESFIALINNLSVSNKIVLIGNKAEQSYIGEIENSLENKQNIINTSGKLSLNQLIALISNCELMITNDTGPMHISFAMQKKTIALFGPCSPVQYGGTGSSIVIYKKVNCSPCVHKFISPPCNGNNICMKGIKVDEVKAVVNETLALIKRMPRNIPKVE